MKTTLSIAQAEHMLFLKQQLLKLNAIIANKKVCYLDIPVHNNLGDLLILKGTLEFLKENGYEVTHCLSLYNFYESAVSNDVTILLHGGGNFGDLYPMHQQFREQIVAKFPNHKIVILPQTIHFSSHEQYLKSCENLAKHQNLHICTRDTLSYERAKKISKYVYLIPDMAHQLYPINLIKKKAPEKIFYFKRRDIEFREDLDESLLVKISDIGDWVDLIGRLNQLIINFTNRIQRIFSVLKLNKVTAEFTSKLWLLYVNYLFRHVVNKMSQFKFVYSSRLHGFILANLMSIDSSLIDNSYSKNKQYYHTWMNYIEKQSEANA